MKDIDKYINLFKETKVEHDIIGSPSDGYTILLSVDENKNERGIKQIILFNFKVDGSIDDIEIWG